MFCLIDIRPKWVFKVGLDRLLLLYLFRSLFLCISPKILPFEQENVFRSFFLFAHISNQHFRKNYVFLRSLWKSFFHISQYINIKRTYFWDHSKNRFLSISNINVSRKSTFFLHIYIFGTNTRIRARPRTFSKLWSA